MDFLTQMWKYNVNGVMERSFGVMAMADVKLVT